jgi:hypothetical protein
MTNMQVQETQIATLPDLCGNKVLMIPTLPFAFSIGGS